MMHRAFERICKGFSEIIPEKTRANTIQPQLDYAGIKEEYALWIGKRIFIIIVVGIIGFAAASTIQFSLGPLTGVLFWIFSSIFLAFLAGVLFYLNVYYKIENRALLVEDSLPDFLMLVGSNVNAGMTPFTAFRTAARKEFGALSEEIKIATAKALGTESFSQALSEVSNKIRSASLDEAVAFINQSLRSGGQLAKLLETTATSIRQTQEMKKELLSGTKMYVVFVIFVVVIASPLLLSVSVEFLKMITKIQAESAATGLDNTISSVSFLSGNLGITPDVMRDSAYALLLINSLLSSMFIGVLVRGRAKSGLRHFPLILLACFTALTIFLAFLDNFFAGFI